MGGEAMTPEADLATLEAALEATWPPLAVDELSAPGWRLRDGGGGGARVSAATRLRADADPDAAIAAMRAQGRAPLFRIRAGEEDLDAALAARGLARRDETLFLVAPAERIAAIEPARGVRAVEVRARLALLDEIWTAAGIGPERRAVMARAEGPRTVVMSRTDMAVAGVGFVAVHGPVAMVHAMVVRPERRRQGGGRGVLRGAARFALDHGARTLALAVTADNAPALALYGRMGMREAGRYHYRAAAETAAPTNKERRP
ncbi:GNAT family N-acetyltransferase [Oceanicella actignis]|uniref:Acetyltransferase (GNAT) family protein n=1 Tax=Oceanicella actignis TaxID=1189325 RepID=A0A1M7TEZ6_9RHOB|nr:GNAT family N-acetyltransferase [Oceanicella actignis]TYO88573.1 acetyltransferase (GNAT) family protein [Oceanicella actignis]SET61926.1 Acetyltransferase (GNAT) family protein [Oceanicella actignis]SHN69231.1 Acetyltransferase (GNAT) family protein [Oceanicella actignis]